MRGEGVDFSSYVIHRAGLARRGNAQRVTWPRPCCPSCRPPGYLSDQLSRSVTFSWKIVPPNAARRRHSTVAVENACEQVARLCGGSYEGSYSCTIRCNVHSLESRRSRDVLGNFRVCSNPERLRGGKYVHLVSRVGSFYEFQRPILFLSHQKRLESMNVIRRPLPRLNEIEIFK